MQGRRVRRVRFEERGGGGGGGGMQLAAGKCYFGVPCALPARALHHRASPFHACLSFTGSACVRPPSSTTPWRGGRTRLAGPHRWCLSSCPRRVGAGNRASGRAASQLECRAQTWFGPRARAARKPQSGAGHDAHARTHHHALADKYPYESVKRAADTQVGVLTQASVHGTSHVAVWQGRHGGAPCCIVLHALLQEKAL